MYSHFLLFGCFVSVDPFPGFFSLPDSLADCFQDASSSGCCPTSAVSSHVGDFVLSGLLICSLFKSLSKARFVQGPCL